MAMARVIFLQELVWYFIISKMQIIICVNIIVLCIFYPSPSVVIVFLYRNKILQEYFYLIFFYENFLPFPSIIQLNHVFNLLMYIIKIKFWLHQTSISLWTRDYLNLKSYLTIKIDYAQG